MGVDGDQFILLRYALMSLVWIFVTYKLLISLLMIWWTIDFVFLNPLFFRKCKLCYVCHIDYSVYLQLSCTYMTNFSLMLPTDYCRVHLASESYKTVNAKKLYLEICWSFVQTISLVWKQIFKVEHVDKYNVDKYKAHSAMDRTLSMLITFSEEDQRIWCR